MTNPRTLSPISIRRFFFLIGGVALATVGLIALVVGINLVASQQWATATGTVQSCTSTSVGTGSSRHVDYQCTITWVEAGAKHSHQIDFGAKPAAINQTYQVKVNGDNVVLPAPAWLAYLTLAIGLGLIGSCIYLIVRSRRTSTGRSAPAGTA